MDLNSVDVQALARAGVPFSVADALISERQCNGPFQDWEELLQRMQRDPSRRSAGSTPGQPGSRRYGFVPVDRTLLKVQGMVIGDDSRNESLQPSESFTNRGRPWWTWPDQGPANDDSFPAEFRSDLTCTMAGQEPVAYTYLFEQIRQTADAAAPYSFMGYRLSRASKDKLVAQWQAAYPDDLSAATLMSREPSPAGAPPSSSDKATSQAAQTLRATCWAALQRQGQDELPAWVGAEAPGQAAGQAIPAQLRDTYRVDAYGNVVANDAEQGAICYWEVDLTFPRKRGGRSTPFNSSAIHWYAKRHVKMDKLLATLVVAKDGRSPLSCGLSEAGLLAVWEQSHTQLPPELHTAGGLPRLLHTLLCTAWRRGGDSKELFKSRAGLLHVTPRAQLFSALLQEFTACTTDLVAGWHVALLAGVAARDQSKAKRQQAKPGLAAAGMPSNLPTSGRPASAVRAFNQVVALGTEVGIPQLAELPLLPDDSINGANDTDAAAADDTGWADAKSSRPPLEAPETPTHDSRAAAQGRLEIETGTASAAARATAGSSGGLAAEVLRTQPPATASSTLKRMRVRMTSATTQTTSAAPQPISGPAHPTQDVEPEPTEPCQPPKPPPSPPPSVRVYAVPMYRPAHGPLAGRPPGRPRNPLADPHITQAFDFTSGAAAPGSSLTAKTLVAGDGGVAASSVWDDAMMADAVAQLVCDEWLNNGPSRVVASFGEGEAEGRVDYWLPQAPDGKRQAAMEEEPQHPCEQPSSRLPYPSPMPVIVPVISSAAAAQGAHVPNSYALLEGSSSSRPSGSKRRARQQNGSRAADQLPSPPHTGFLSERRDRRSQQGAVAGHVHDLTPLPDTNVTVAVRAVQDVPQALRGSMHSITSVARQSAGFAAGVLQIHQLQQRHQQAGQLAQEDGSATGHPLWPGSPVAPTSPALGSGQPYPALRQRRSAQAQTGEGRREDKLLADGTISTAHPPPPTTRSGRFAAGPQQPSSGVHGATGRYVKGGAPDRLNTPATPASPLQPPGSHNLAAATYQLSNASPTSPSLDGQAGGAEQHMTPWGPVVPVAMQATSPTHEEALAALPPPPSEPKEAGFEKRTAPPDAQSAARPQTVSSDDMVTSHGPAWVTPEAMSALMEAALRQGPETHGSPEQEGEQQAAGGSGNGMPEANQALRPATRTSVEEYEQWVAQQQTELNVQPSEHVLYVAQWPTREASQDSPRSRSEKGPQPDRNSSDDLPVIGKAAPGSTNAPPAAGGSPAGHDTSDQVSQAPLVRGPGVVALAPAQTKRAGQPWSAITELDLPPPAFYRTSSGRMEGSSSPGGGQQPGPALGASTGASGTLVKPVISKATSSVKKLVSTVSDWLKTRKGRDGDRASVSRHSPVAIGILPTSLEVVTEEQEEEMREAQRQDAAGSVLSRADGSTTATVHGDAPASPKRATSPSTNAWMSAALSGVKDMVAKVRSPRGAQRTGPASVRGARKVEAPSRQGVDEPGSLMRTMRQHAGQVKQGGWTGPEASTGTLIQAVHDDRTGSVHGERSSRNRNRIM